MMPFRVEAHNIRFAFECRLVELYAHMLAAPKFLAAAGDNPQLISPAANAAFDASNVLALAESEILVLQACLTEGANVLDRVAILYRFIVLIDNFDASHMVIKVDADLTDLRKTFSAVQVNHLLQVFMVVFGIIASFNLGLLNDSLPGRSICAKNFSYSLFDDFIFRNIMREAVKNNSATYAYGIISSGS